VLKITKKPTKQFYKKSAQDNQKTNQTTTCQFSKKVLWTTKKQPSKQTAKQPLSILQESAQDNQNAYQKTNNLSILQENAQDNQTVKQTTNKQTTKHPSILQESAEITKQPTKQPTKQTTQTANNHLSI